jgi:Protein of unknown function (DUF2997)
LNQTIEITVDTKGETTVQAKGFSGSSCRAASQFIEKALGERLSEQMTAELHQVQPEAETIKQGQ